MFYKRIIDFEEKKKNYFFDYTPTQKIKYFAKIYDDLGKLINKSICLLRTWIYNYGTYNG